MTNKSIDSIAKDCIIMKGLFQIRTPKGIYCSVSKLVASCLYMTGEEFKLSTGVSISCCSYNKQVKN